MEQDNRAASPGPQQHSSESTGETSDHDEGAAGPLGPSVRWDGLPSGRGEAVREVWDRARDLADQRSVRVVAVVAVAGLVGLWWFLAGAAPEASSAASGPFTAGGTTIAFATSSTPTSSPPEAEGDTPGTSAAPDADIVVHAAGAVRVPGVYRLVSGARIGDLITAAGGLTGDADGDRLNLAAPLADGVRVYVPRIGEAETPTIQDVDGPVGASGSSGTPGSGAGGGSPGEKPDGPVNLNEATLDQLDELPGIGPATAQAIVTHREQNGPFSSVEDLLEVRGIGPAKLEQLRPLVSV